MLTAKILNRSEILKSFDTSIIEYECPKCETVYSAEADCGVLTCDCGVELDCNILNIF